MAYDPYGSGDFGASPFDDIFARFFGGAAAAAAAADRHRPAADRAGPRGNQGRRHPGRPVGRPRPRHRPPAVGHHQAGTGPPPARARRAPTRTPSPGRSSPQAEHGQPREEAPNLTPASKRALLDARQISRALGSSYIGPEHLLFALAVNPESAAGRVLRDARVTPEALQEAVTERRPRAAERARRPPSDTPTIDQFGTDLTAMAREGRLDPVIGRERRDRADHRGARPGAPRTTRCSSASPASARPRSSRASPSGSSTATCPTRCATSALVAARPRAAWSRAPGTAATSRSG